VGIDSQLLEMPAETTPQELLATIDKLNKDDACDGILVQLPLPTPELQKQQSAILERILPDKDVDGFHPYNLGCLVTREPKLRPCTPFGVMHLLWSTGVNPYGLRCVVVGASNHVGRPMMLELLLNGASVQIVHRFTQDLEQVVREAECLIVACGKPGLVRGEWIRPGAVVIDVGINRLESGKLVGDVDFEVAKERAGWITPVPGGVGPMTVAMLLRNTMTAYRVHRSTKNVRQVSTASTASTDA
jgi:methylenetetrahydrofolate dehydrogenase (NADP+)/methenyltetrahydrofolate cyclohydrolase